MKNGNEFISACFRDLTAKDILGEESLRYNHLSGDVMLKLLERAQHKYSRNELRGQIEYLRDESLKYKNRWLVDTDEHSELDVFSVLFAYLSDILIVKDNTVLCRYEKFLHWRMMTLNLHEDMLICAFLANYDSIENIWKRSFFDWPVVIGHNNTELNMILSRGLAENHFHLKGSAPAFHLAWNYLMNNPLGIKEKLLLEDIEIKRRTVSYGTSKKHGEDSLDKQILQAAAIRVYLFCRLLNISLNDSEKEWEEIEYFRKNINLLSIQSRADTIYGWISGLRIAYGYLENGLLRDYAVLDRGVDGHYCSYDMLHADPDNKDIYGGERRFMYLAFQAIKEQSLFTADEINLFFAYLVIKERFRGELQQLNKEYVGFENFAIFEGRKGFFVDDKDLVYSAMQRPLHSSGVQFLEARICPYETAAGNKDLIDRMDRYIVGAVDNDQIEIKGEDNTENGKKYVSEKIDDSLFKYAYIMHFVKEEDDSLNKDNYILNGFICRHEKLRRKLKKQSNAIKELRERYPEQAKKVVGIDACNQEIGCRPEVFAPSFRMLRKHVVEKINNDMDQDVPQLRITYHVGEDFLDPLDGMRAISEAMCFLEMECGDRLGHALALGIDVNEWYESKGDVTIPVQDYLDNITWLYFALSDYNIRGFDNLKTHILDEFNVLFNRIYRSNIHTRDLRSITKKADEYYQKQQRFKYYHGGVLNFDIFNYQKSCMLRGDDPHYYRKGYFEYAFPNDYRFAPYGVNMSFPKQFDDRMIPEASLLYYYYHYDWDVKTEGAKYITKEIHPDYVKAVDLIQRKLQREIAAKGISIEANPTSNYLIGTFKRYDKHPIIRWYNHGLETNPEKLAHCPQISVSINTDEMGVFTTRLDNEYSLMALALERVRDENNNRVYLILRSLKTADNPYKYCL